VKQQPVLAEPASVLGSSWIPESWSLLNLIKWFHEHGVPQVVTIDKEVFKYD
jgi:hypothetical protein